MIRYIPHNEIDFDKWDQCIDTAMNGIFYAYSWYRDMCSTSWDALVQDDYRAVMPLPVRKKFGIKYIYQPFFIQQLGVFSNESLTAAITEMFLESIPSDIRFVDYNLNTFNRLPEQHIAIKSKGKTYELDLILPYEQLRAKYAENTKRNIKKATRNDLFVTAHARPEEIINVFRKNSRRYHVPFREQDYRVLKHLIYAGMHKGMVSIKAAYTSNNNFCGGIVFYRSHQKVVWLFSGATPEARTTGAMSLLVDTFIQENAGKELVLDFEGSSNPGLARFYRGFGSEECVFLQIEMNNMPFFAKSLLNSVLYAKRFFRK
jgi:hypothetical protein